jgi:hypothetical protein
MPGRIFDHDPSNSQNLVIWSRRRNASPEDEPARDEDKAQNEKTLHYANKALKPFEPH